MSHSGRLSTLAGAFVVARRDFMAILWSRSFIFFLLGPLFPLFVGAMAGSIGAHVEDAADTPQIGRMMAGGTSSSAVKVNNVANQSPMRLEMRLMVCFIPRFLS